MTRHCGNCGDPGHRRTSCKLAPRLLRSGPEGPALLEGDAERILLKCRGLADSLRDEPRFAETLLVNVFIAGMLHASVKLQPPHGSEQLEALDGTAASLAAFAEAGAAEVPSGA